MSTLGTLFHVWPTANLKSNEIRGDLLVMSLNNVRFEGTTQIFCEFGTNRVRRNIVVRLTAAEYAALLNGEVIRKSDGNGPRAFRRCDGPF